MPQNGTIGSEVADESAVAATRETLAVTPPARTEREQRDTGPLRRKRADRFGRSDRLRARVLRPRRHIHQFAVPLARSSHADVHICRDLPLAEVNVRLPAHQRRRQLLDTALEVFANEGFHATSMNDVADAAGVTKPVLYQHFASKRELYLELLEDVGTRLGQVIEDATLSAGGPH